MAMDICLAVYDTTATLIPNEVAVTPTCELVLLVAGISNHDRCRIRAHCIAIANYILAFFGIVDVQRNKRSGRQDDDNNKYNGEF
jgi:hypothetical protein